MTERASNRVVINGHPLIRSKLINPQPDAGQRRHQRLRVLCPATSSDLQLPLATECLGSERGVDPLAGAVLLAHDALCVDP